MNMITPIALVLLLSACSNNPVVLPAPPPEIIRITPPETLLTQESQPLIPNPDTATQLDVGNYINDLHAWGQRGWVRINEIKNWKMMPVPVKDKRK